MSISYPPINPKFPHFLHGGDYNPDQWIATPEVWDEDMRLMKLAGCNAMSVGIFSWSQLEPEEGRFEFGWLDTIMDKLAENDAFAVLATPSGARPAWMSRKYPEVLRVNADRTRILHGMRHNHCPTSPVYREKVSIINRKLADRYKDHPALLVWHVSNEYGGECHCELCQEAFRAWLRERYNNDIDALNQAWWMRFWSHAATDFSQIESPCPHGESRVHGLSLDWKRFVTDQTIDFFESEIVPLRELTPGVPVTTNFMGTYPGLNYFKFAPHLDVISLDSYPGWHSHPDVDIAMGTAFVLDLNRCLKGGQPFMLMESTPSATNWQRVCKLKRPGMHKLASLQAVAHGSDTVQYFQWRKGRGSSEKFHGAVVDHVGHENNRVFRDVAEVGEALKRLDPIIGTTVRPEAAVIFDWENMWAFNDALGPRNIKKDYLATCHRHYSPLWRRSIPVDVIDADQPFDGYKLLIAPLLYMVRSGVGERIESFVEKGGTFVATYWSGIANETDLVYLGGFPGPLRKVLGIWAEEIDALFDGETNHVVPVEGNALRLSARYEASELCDLIHAETAEVLATYAGDFYAGRPALTVNKFGKGRAYYVASRNEGRFQDDFYAALVEELGIEPVLAADMPAEVVAAKRTNGERDFVFLMNFAPAERAVEIREEGLTDLEDGYAVSGAVTLRPYQCLILGRG